MRKKWSDWLDSQATLTRFLFLSLFIGFVTQVQTAAQPQEGGSVNERHNQIRQEKFNLVIPQAMKKYNIDMWIHVMRAATADPFGSVDLGTSSGLVVFTDRGGDRVERAVLGRRWGATQRQMFGGQRNLVKESGAYDIIAEPIFVGEPLAGPTIEYDLRFKGLREFVEARNPKRIAVNFRETLGTWPTCLPFFNRGDVDGISHIDHILLSKELGDEYADRLVSSEHLIMEYQMTPVPTEVALLKKLRRDEVEVVKKAFAAIVPGVTRSSGAGLTTFRRMSTGLSQRGRSAGWENSVVRGGDILAAPSQGMYAYVLREGETEPPPQIEKLWAEYIKIKKILERTIKAGRTGREIVQDYTRKFEEEGIVVRGPQLHMVQPKNDFPTFSKDFDPEQTQISIDAHGKGMGSDTEKYDLMLGPRIGSYGPDWTLEIPLAPNHHFVLEYFFYMPSPTSNGDDDQYLLWWDHEQAIATKSGVEYLYPLQEELFLIR